MVIYIISLKRWVTDEEDIEKLRCRNITTKKSEIPKPEENLVNWILEIERTSNFPLTVECIQIKSITLCDKEEQTANKDFKFSRWWFYNFTKRHNLQLKRPYGNSDLVNREEHEGDITRIR